MRCFLILSGLLAFAACRAAEPARLGVLQHDDRRSAEVRAAGVEYTVLEVVWSRLEPEPGRFDAAYAEEVKKRQASRRAAGFRLCLDLGIQYPPAWALELPNGTYVNQYGDAYVDRRSGWLSANAVFSRNVREALERYVTKVRELFGDDFALIRLGWGHYGELNYPTHKFAERTNCYWGFDPAAQGKSPELLPEGVKPVPVPGWRPGDSSPGGEAAKFLEWYLDSLKNYHDWQIALVRRLYPEVPGGMMYPSWGIRPGQNEKAVAGNLGGGTPAERNGEIPRGLDFERFTAGITDPAVIVYCTWIDSSPAFGDDSSARPDRWSPPHWLSSLARKHPLKLRVWGENTGGGGIPAAELTAKRAAEYNIEVVSWAFEPRLFNGSEPNLKQLTEIFRKK
ncbi:MAG: hypothetical protein HPZ91_05600 [Lentisphaeria bacterium]|nr:hypothetical protein [Lentisphaeria bacterium]